VSPSTSSVGATSSSASRVQPPSRTIAAWVFGSVMSATRSPDTKKVRPFTAAAASVQSHTTNGAIRSVPNTSGSSALVPLPMVRS